MSVPPPLELPPAAPPRPVRRRPTPIPSDTEFLLVPEQLTVPPPPQLPAFVAELIVKDAVARSLQCPITMTPFEECTKLTVTSCYHTFEAVALETWMFTHTTCPACAQTVTSSVTLPQPQAQAKLNPPAAPTEPSPLTTRTKWRIFTT